MPFASSGLSFSWLVLANDWLDVVWLAPCFARRCLIFLVRSRLPIFSLKKLHCFSTTMLRLFLWLYRVATVWPVYICPYGLWSLSQSGYYGFDLFLLLPWADCHSLGTLVLLCLLIWAVQSNHTCICCLISDLI